MEIKKLIKELGLTQGTLHADIMSQPKLMWKAAEYRVEKMRRHMAAKSALEDAKVQAAKKYRSLHMNDKVTVQQVNEAVASDPTVQDKQVLCDEASAMEEYGKLMYYSYKERGDMAQAMVRLLGSEAAKDARFLEAELARLGADKIREEAKERYRG